MFETSQFIILCLKAFVDWNIDVVLVALARLQFPMLDEDALLNAVAPLNILSKVVTCDTSQFPISWLNATQFLNKELMFVTFETFQFPIADEDLTFSLL